MLDQQEEARKAEAGRKGVSERSKAYGEKGKKLVEAVAEVEQPVE